MAPMIFVLTLVPLGLIGGFGDKGLGTGLENCDERKNNKLENIHMSSL